MSNKSKEICIIIAGMHRSGTSALTRVLSMLGADLPKTLMGASTGNETGHWESVEFMHFNDEILSSAGSAWNDWTQITPGWFESIKAEEFYDKAINAYRSEYGNNRLTIMKDPRNCRILPFWIDTLNKNDIDVKIILPIRNPSEVAASLYKRDGMNKHLGLLLWLRHVLDAEYFSRGQNRVFSTYNQLMENWSLIADKVEKDLGVFWPKRSVKISEEIDDYISPKYRNFANNDGTILKNSTIPSSIRDTYEIMLKWADSGEEEGDFSKLDKIRKEFDASSLMFAPLVDAYQKSDAIVKQLNNEVANINNQNSELKNHIANLDNSLNQKADESSNQQRHIGELEQEKLDITENLNALKLNLEQITEESSKRQWRIGELEQEKLDITKNLNALKLNIEQITEESSNQQRHIGELEQEKLDLANSNSNMTNLINSNAIMIEELRESLKITEERLIKSYQISYENYNKSQVDISNLSINIAKLSDEKDSLKALNLQLSSNVEEKTSKINLLNIEINELTDLAKENDHKIHLLDSSLKQKSAEIEDRINEFQNEKAAHDNTKNELSSLQERFAMIEAEANALKDKLHINEQNIAALNSEKADLISKLNDKNHNNQILSDRINEITSKLEQNEHGKQEIIKRLLVVQQKLDETQIVEAEATKAKIGLIEQITHEERPYFSLKRSSIKRQANLLRNAGIVDEEWYIKEYPDVADTGMNPTLHWVKHGKKEGRKPRE